MQEHDIAVAYFLSISNLETMADTSFSKNVAKTIMTQKAMSQDLSQFIRGKLYPLALTNVNTKEIIAVVIKKLRYLLTINRLFSVGI
ncbi:hypothetical protein [Lactobacillus xylocopicola]|uniref:Uncharacterized protein n=1 Tax=Lactobacillus xylocopicola TaxID=2976676 RepID=A0ABM8BH46_9LACO|nr:hypothetical protein [Lactobacillus xylocopicola]BDR60608.1 hypothetical protein KIM322_08690 [Lactobacillus xylocopicola]